MDPGVESDITDDWNDADAWLSARSRDPPRELQEGNQDSRPWEGDWKVDDESEPWRPYGYGGGYGPYRYNEGYGAHRAQPPFQYQQRWEPYRGYVAGRQGFLNSDVSLAEAGSSGWSASTFHNRGSRNLRRSRNQNWHIQDHTVEQRPAPALPTVRTQTVRQEGPFEFPTRHGGNFERAMRTFANAPEEGLAGTGLEYNTRFEENFRTEVSQALALKLNLKTQQHANEKMLRSLVKAGGRCLTLKQAVQARAAVYDEVADPS